MKVTDKTIFATFIDAAGFHPVRVDFTAEGVLVTERPPMYVPDMDDQTGVVLNAIKNAPPVGALPPIERDVWA